MGARGRKCAACDPAISGRIAALVEAGVAYAEIGAATGLSKYTISRHARHSKPDAPAPVVSEPQDELETADQDLDKLIEDLRQQFNAAVSVGDSKHALSVSKALATQQNEKRRRLLEKKKAVAAVTDPATGTLAIFDAIIRGTETFQQKQKGWGMVECPLCGEGMVYPKDARANLPAVQALATQPDPKVFAELLPGVPNPNPQLEPMTSDQPPIH